MKPSMRAPTPSRSASCFDWEAPRPSAFYPTGSDIAILNLVQKGVPPDWRSLERSLPGDLRDLVAHALERDRDRRFQSAGEMADGIDAILRRRARDFGPARLAEYMTSLYRTGLARMEIVARPRELDAPRAGVTRAAVRARLLEECVEAIRRPASFWPVPRPKWRSLGVALSAAVLLICRRRAASPPARAVARAAI